MRRYVEVTRFAVAVAAAESGEVGARRGERGASSDARSALVDAILRLGYYWYNFMPLARGSAAAGYVVVQVT